MNDRELAHAILILCLLAAALSGCGGAVPTGPELPQGPAFVVRPANPEQQALADTWWVRQAACVGVQTTTANGVPVNVVPDAFDCGGVMAAGCMRYTSITVVSRWYEPALSHEFIHYALWKKGGESIGHDNPAFLRCDTLNVGSVPDGGVQ